MPLVQQSIHQRFAFPGPLVLGFTPLNFLPPAVDRDQTVLQRSKLRSCTAFLGEQPNPWNRLQFQDAIMAQSRDCYQPHPSGPKPYVKVSLHTAPTGQQKFFFN